MIDLGPATRVAVESVEQAMYDAWDDNLGLSKNLDRAAEAVLAALAEPRRTQCETCGGSGQFLIDVLPSYYDECPDCVDGFVTLPPPWQAWVVEQGLEVEWEPNMFRRVPRPTEEEK